MCGWERGNFRDAFAHEKISSRQFRLNLNFRLIQDCFFFGNRFTVRARRHMREYPGLVQVSLRGGLHRAEVRDQHQRVRIAALPEPGVMPR
jgi:hypothetical protein